MAEPPDDLDALKRAAYGRSAPEERAAAEARLAELQAQPTEPDIEPPRLSRVRPWWAAIVVTALLCVLAASAASFVVWAADSRRIFDRPPTDQDLAATWSEDLAPGGTARWLGEFSGRDVYAVESATGTICVVVPLGGGGAAIACAEALEFSQHGVGLVSRTIEGDFALVWGPTGGVRWGEFP